MAIDAYTVRAVGAAATGTLVWALPWVAAYLWAFQTSLWAAVAVAVLMLIEYLTGLCHDLVATHVQPAVNQLWGVER